MTPNRYGSADLDRAVAAEVRAEIGRQKISVSMIASTIGMRRATLSSRLNSRAAFTPSLLADVAQILGTSASELTARAERSLIEPAPDSAHQHAA